MIQDALPKRPAEKADWYLGLLGFRDDSHFHVEVKVRAGMSIRAAKLTVAWVLTDMAPAKEVSRIEFFRFEDMKWKLVP